MTNKQRLVQILAGSAAALGLAGAAQAGVETAASVDSKAPIGKSPKEAAQPKEESVFDRIWGLATLYKDDSNGFIEELAITGRYHGQFWAADGPSGNDNDWENRRFRVGLQATMFDKHLTLKGEIFSDLNSGGEFYEGFTELYAAFKASDALTVTVGKQKPKFSYEWSTSSRMIPTFERNSLLNSFRPDYAAGVTISGKVDKISYYTGVFSDEVDKEFGGFDGGWSYIASIGYDVKDVLGADKAEVRLDYIHSEIDEADTVFNKYENGVDLSLSMKKGALGLTTEVLAGFGSTNNWSLIVTPTYDVTKKLQLAFRYQLGLSDDDQGFPAQRRYERAVGLGSGDVYNALYAGVNYFIYEHKLKLMTGAEWANMSGGGGDTWTYFAGIRAYW